MVVVFDVEQGSIDVFIRGQIVNMFGLADHNVCVTTTQFCPLPMTLRGSHIQYVGKWVTRFQ